MQYKQQKARKESVNVQCPTFNSVGDDGMSVRAKAPKMLGDLRPRDAPAPPTHAPTTTAIAITTEIDQPTDNPQTVHSLPTNSTWQASKPSSLFPSYAPHVPLLLIYHLDAHTRLTRLRRCWPLASCSSFSPQHYGTTTCLC